MDTDDLTPAELLQLARRLPKSQAGRLRAFIGAPPTWAEWVEGALTVDAHCPAAAIPPFRWPDPTLALRMQVAARARHEARWMAAHAPQLYVPQVAA